MIKVSRLCKVKPKSGDTTPTPKSIQSLEVAQKVAFAKPESVVERNESGLLFIVEEESQSSKSSTFSSV